jgi:uncharacterized protein YijF (DUF1287 family)
VRKLLATSVVLLLLAVSFAQAPPVAQEQFMRRLVDSAVAREKVHVRYVSSYVRLDYPNGDVPAGTGVCTDEIIRVYRGAGVDLQKEVHEDMVQHLSEYPLHGRRADSNIDHRRVPNLQEFFARKGAALKITHDASDYQPGDIVAWNLGGRTTHIGIVVDRTNLWGRYKVLHNIGAGPKIEDVLFDWKIIGHYRYYGPPA